MTFLRRTLRRRRAQLALLACGGTLLLAVVACAQRSPRQVPDPPVRSLAAVTADARRQARAAQLPSTRRSSVLAATPVPDVPLAWRRITALAATWPDPSSPPVIGREARLPTVPAARMRDAIGMNIDIWRNEDAYANFPGLLTRVRELHLRHARVNMQSGATFGLARMQQLGAAGVRLDVIMGDAYGRYGTSSYPTLAERLQSTVLPYVDAVEGTNEADLSGRDDWIAAARAHQQGILGTVQDERRKPIGVLAPSVGRVASIGGLGDVASIADAANAHAYASGMEPGRALGQWLTAMRGQLPGGPTVVTETGFQTDTGQRKYHTPTSEQAAAAYVPRTILEGIRRGAPQLYLYELADRWKDPLGIDTAAHFGLLRADLTPKPAWRSLVRLQRALLDNGRPDAAPEPVPATVETAPGDLRTLALRRRDGTIALALWRAAPVWDPQTLQDVDVPAVPVRLRVPAQTSGALATDLVTGARSRLRKGGTIDLALAGSPVVVTGLQPSAEMAR